MKVIKRFIYLGYYIWKLNTKDYRRYLSYVKNLKKRSKLSLIVDSVRSVFVYNISLMEYFYFRFYQLSKEERATFAGTGTLYEYQLIMNPKQYRASLEDKRIFHEVYTDFIDNDWMDLVEIREDHEKTRAILNNTSGKIVTKKHDGQCGVGVEVIESNDMKVETLIELLESSGNNMLESYIVQHPDLMELSPSGLNTVRIYTQLDHEDRVEILGCRLRITVDSVVDNMAAGNVAAPIDTETGLVNGPAVYSDISKDPVSKHPITGTPIENFQIPFWEKTMDMIQKAALHNKQCRSVGWDVAISSKGPQLLEGNHDWCKLVWQLPVQKGLKHVLKRHLLEYKSIKN
jgi:hypothetical protein